jgi:hypothetical protein
MKPSRLVWMTDNIAFEIPEIPSGLVKKRVSVPRGGAEIPQMRNYKEKDPEQEECCFRLYKKPETSRHSVWAWQESDQQEEHAKQPADRLGEISPCPF